MRRAGRDRHEAQRLLGAGLADRAGDGDDPRRPCGARAATPRRRMASSTSATTTQRARRLRTPPRAPPRRPPPPRPSQRVARRSRGRRAPRRRWRRTGRPAASVRVSIGDAGRAAAIAAQARRLSLRRSRRGPEGRLVVDCQPPRWPARDRVVIGERQARGRRRSGPFHGPCRRRPGRRRR